MKPDGTDCPPALADDTLAPDRSKRRAPKLKVGEDGVLSLTVRDENQMRELLGVKTDAAANGIMLSALNALGVSGAPYRGMIAAMGAEMEPRDAVEAMLYSQQVATHVAMMTLRCIHAIRSECTASFVSLSPRSASSPPRRILQRPSPVSPKEPRRR